MDIGSSALFLGNDILVAPITAFAGHLKLAVTKREMQPLVIQLIRDSCPSNRPGMNRLISSVISCISRV